MPAPSILAFAGSLRAESFNKKMVRVAAQGATSVGAQVQYIDLRDFPLPVFDEDLERAEGLPANALKLKEIFKANQGLLLACPEYNSSITAVLKNTIDWVSRPVANEAPLAAFAGKSAVLMSASPGQLGGLRGLVTVRMLLGNIRVTVLPDQLAIPKIHEAIDGTGQFKDPALQQSVQKLGVTLAEHLQRLHRA